MKFFWLRCETKALLMLLPHQITRGHKRIISPDREVEKWFIIRYVTLLLRLLPHFVNKPHLYKPADD